MHSNQDAIWSHFQKENQFDWGRTRPRHKYLAKQLGVTPLRVLNVGIGGGVCEAELLLRGHHVSALDPDPATVQSLCEKTAVDARVGYLQKIPFGSECFDAVVLSEVYEHLDDSNRKQALAELRRILKPGGTLIGTVPWNENLKESEVVCPCCGTLFHRWGHQASFTVPRLRQELELGGFKDLKLTIKVFPDEPRGALDGLKQVARVVVGFGFPDKVYSTLVFLGKTPQ